MRWYLTVFSFEFLWLVSWAFSHVTISYLNVFFGKMYIWVFCHFKIGLCFNFLQVGYVSYILNINLFSDLWFTISDNLSFHFVCYFFGRVELCSAVYPSFFFCCLCIWCHTQKNISEDQCSKAFCQCFLNAHVHTRNGLLFIHRRRKSCQFSWNGQIPRACIKWNKLEKDKSQMVSFYLWNVKK